MEIINGRSDDMKMIEDNIRVLMSVISEHELNYALRPIVFGTGNIQITVETLKTAFFEAEEDCRAIYEHDPSADSLSQVKFSYPGYEAMLMHRFAHLFWKSGNRDLGRYISEAAHRTTGIDIHPGACIGKRFAIDHGTGIVIGETAVIGDDCVMYQGALLGAKSLHGRTERGSKRHPTIGNRVVMYAYSTVLGNINVGDDCIIGAYKIVNGDVQSGTKVI